MSRRPTIFAAVFLVSALLVAIESAATAKLPPAAAIAERNLRPWVQSFVGKNANELERILGAPTERGTWENEGTKLPVLTYETPEGATLGLYFGGDGAVLTVSYQMISK